MASQTTLRFIRIRYLFAVRVIGLLLMYVLHCIIEALLNRYFGDTYLFLHLQIQ